MIEKIKKSVLLSLVVALVISPLATHSSFAHILTIDGGIVGALHTSGLYEYEEVVFITGQPVRLRGLVNIPVIPQGRDTYRLTYQFDLSSPDGEVTLSRSVTYAIEKKQRGHVSQSLYSKTIANYTETIVTPQGTFTLAAIDQLESRTYEHTNAVDYFSGNLNGSRKYYLNGDFNNHQGVVFYNIQAHPMIGYQHPWGSSETQRIRYTIESYMGHESEIQNGLSPAWSGSVDVDLSTTEKVIFDFHTTTVQNIPFREHATEHRRAEHVLVYKYDLPMANNRRNTGTERVMRDVLLSSRSLVAPHIRDIGGHWAEHEIRFLTSLEVFDPSKPYFVPDAEISRLEFAKAIVVAVNGGPLPEPSRNDVQRRRRPGVETPFLDVKVDDPDYHYMEYVREQGIMNGRNGYFKGDEPIMRAEAMAIMVRTLGIEKNAPAPPYQTQFKDDAAIPEWAKDYIYMGHEVGLIRGSDGYIFPRRPLSKAETAVMIENYIYHLKDTINYDYREKILAQ